MKAKDGGFPHPEDWDSENEGEPMERGHCSQEFGDEHLFLMKRGSRHAVEVRRLQDHIIWQPTLGHDILSFSRDEAFRLISSPGLSLAGHDARPTKDLLMEPEECEFQRMLHDGAFDQSSFQSAYDIYCTLGALLRAFDRVEMRAKQVFTRANFERAQTAAKRLRMVVHALDDPHVKLVSGGKHMDAFLLDCKVHAAKFALWADILDRETRCGDNDDSQNLVQFIRGPLSDCYKGLFGRDAGGNERGPFARFGACFFEMVGHKVPPSTIVRAVKKTLLSKKK